MNNFYPVLHRFYELKSLNILPLFVGTGFGSASVINNFYFGTLEINNPNANIVRSFYESGIIGTLLFLLSFIYPIKRKLVPKKVKKIILFYMLFILGAYLAQRSVAPFIFLGIAIVLLEHKWPETNRKSFF